MHGLIQSIGPPPERHADRVVAEMMRELARKHAWVWETIAEVVNASADGNPAAQRRMEERIKRIGVLATNLDPGKRGRYRLLIYDLTGWNQRKDREIVFDDKIPERPWIACNVIIIKSEGRGADRVTFRSKPMVLISHHAMSRTAQRLGMRTGEHMLKATHAIWTAALDVLHEKEDDWLNAPLEGWRVPMRTADNAIVVLKKHRKRDALVAATVLD